MVWGGVLASSSPSCITITTILITTVSSFTFISPKHLYLICSSLKPWLLGECLAHVRYSGNVC